MVNQKFKGNFILITYAILLSFALLNSHHIFNFIGKWFNVFMPFIFGFVIAYLMNWPYNFFREKVYSPILKNKKDSKKIINILSIVTAYFLIFGIFIFLMLIIIPEIVSSVQQFFYNLPQYISSSSEFIDSIENRFNIDILSAEQTNNILNAVASNINPFADKLFPSVFNFTKSFTIGIYNLAIGLIISLYLIGSRDKLIKQFKTICYIYIPKNTVNKISEILHLSHSTFGNFLAGKVLDSFIIGILCFTGMNILKIPYDLIISTLVGITNIIPFFGPFIGAIPSILILLLVDPIKALWFTLFILILQQIDGNIIGPKILGNSVGISGLWIMFSVIIGGGLFGVTGMIIGVPAFAVLYTIISENIKKHRKQEDTL